MSRPKVKSDVRRLPIDAINEPKMLVRENLGDREELLELGASMKNTGQIQPIVVVQNGERYDLVVGHRRLHAAKLVQLVDIEAKIIEADLVQQSLMRYKENNERLANSPYEEAMFVAEMLQNIGCSQIELSKLMGKSAAYVAQRVAILEGYPCVREALKNREINFVQARELLLMPTENDAKQYLQIAVKSGATADLLRAWRSDLGVAYKKIEGEELSEEARESKRDEIRLLFRRCELCSTVTDPADLVYLRTCRVCYNTMLKEIEKARR